MKITAAPRPGYQLPPSEYLPWRAVELVSARAVSIISWHEATGQHDLFDELKTGTVVLDARVAGIRPGEPWVRLLASERAAVTAARTWETGTSHSGTVRTRSYGVDAAIVHLKRHERGIHIV